MTQAALQKIQEINTQIQALQNSQKEIEQQVAMKLVDVLKANNGFALDFDIVVGGLLHVLKTAAVDDASSVVWKEEGAQFLKSQMPSRTRKATSKMEKATSQIQPSTNSQNVTQER